MKTPYLDNLIRNLDPSNFKEFSLKKRERIAKERAEYIAIKKALSLSDVSQQRKQLLAYHRYLTEELNLNLHEIWVDEHLKANNCG